MLPLLTQRYAKNIISFLIKIISFLIKFKNERLAEILKLSIMKKTCLYDFEAP